MVSVKRKSHYELQRGVDEVKEAVITLKKQNQPIKKEKHQEGPNQHLNILKKKESTDELSTTKAWKTTKDE